MSETLAFSNGSLPRVPNARAGGFAAACIVGMKIFQDKLTQMQNHRQDDIVEATNSKAAPPVDGTMKALGFILNVFLALL
jgi:hypothetical protein